MGRSGRLLLKGSGYLLAVLLVLAAVATIVGIAFAIAATVISVIVSLLVLGLFLAAAYGLFVYFRGGESAAENAGTDTVRQPIESESTVNRRPPTDRELADRLRERYVTGELDEAEFERRMELLLEPGDGFLDGDDSTTATDPEREW